MNWVSVAVLARDPIAADGARAALHGRPGIRLVLGDAEVQARVLIVIAGTVDGALLSMIEEFVERAESSSVRVVLVVNRLPEYYLLRAFECGLVSVLAHGEVDYETIVRTAINANRARSTMPEPLLFALLERIRQSQERLHSTYGLTSAGLNKREIEVLRLLSDGLDTVEIAVKLNYSERTIKTVLQVMMTRLGLNSRAHAVAYAIRCGMV
ncbi:LuxR C-terminal-related transcriptional regulator [Amycolatopsis sp. NPDC059090]|uniref:helix-turn-helix transcriptional regulator n=1 Tax=unclassified Amycolatopsis TaxID=2618356 RepID=UPI00366E3C3A